MKPFVEWHRDGRQQPNGRRGRVGSKVTDVSDCQKLSSSSAASSFTMIIGALTNNQASALYNGKI